MKYAVRYNRTFKHFDKIDEVIFKFFISEGFIEGILSKIKNQKQKIIISLVEIDQEISDVLPILNKIKEKHDNTKVIIDFFNQRDLIPILKENNIDFFFDQFARNLTILATMYKLGASEVYIAEDLCFELHKIQYFRTKGMKYRVWPDIAQTSAGSHGVLSPNTEFFIRPEDIELYEKFVDTMELMRSDNRENIIYEIYQQEQWLGKLNDIIIDFEGEVDNTTIFPFFGKQRLMCRRRCLFSKCDICNSIESFGKDLEKTDIEIIKTRKKYKNSTIPQEVLKEIIGEKNES